jgi:hypothetical protein
MTPFYIIASASIFAHIALGFFLWYICMKHVRRRDRRHLASGSIAFHQLKQKKVYKHVEQTPSNEQLYGYWVHCEIGPILISNN